MNSKKRQFPIRKVIRKKTKKLSQEKADIFVCSVSVTSSLINLNQVPRQRNKRKFHPFVQS